jgi:hypothetical protein
MYTLINKTISMAVGECPYNIKKLTVFFSKKNKDKISRSIKASPQQSEKIYYVRKSDSFLKKIERILYVKMEDGVYGHTEESKAIEGHLQHLKTTNKIRNNTDVYLNFFHHHQVYKHDVSKANCFHLQVNHIMKAICFRNIVLVHSVITEKIQIHISDVSHVAPLSKNYNAYQQNTLTR